MLTSANDAVKGGFGPSEVKREASRRCHALNDVDFKLHVELRYLGGFRLAVRAGICDRLPGGRRRESGKGSSECAAVDVLACHERDQTYRRQGNWMRLAFDAQSSAVLLLSLSVGGSVAPSLIGLEQCEMGGSWGTVVLCRFTPACA